jgi:hypothetical protein
MTIELINPAALPPQATYIGGRSGQAVPLRVGAPRWSACG